MTNPGDCGVHGWLVIDKPYGMSSARVVALVRRASGAKTGHAGTLDPLATGILPLALGEATKTIQFAAAGKK
ncbi:MAG: tRNA pseudouridine(55) synthase TruB, partial [Stellaceae bacterium]